MSLRRHYATQCCAANKAGSSGSSGGATNHTMTAPADRYPCGVENRQRVTESLASSSASG